MSNRVIDKLSEEKISYKNSVYYAAFLIMVLKGLCAYSELLLYSFTRPFMTFSNLLFLFLLMYKMFFLQKYTIRQVITIFLLGLVTLYSDRVTDMFIFMPNLLFLASTQDVDFKGVIRKVYKIEAVFLTIHVIIYAFLWIFNRDILYFSVRMEDTGYKYRHQFLLSHANSASMLVLWTILGYLYSEYDTLNKKKIFCAWGAYVFLYLFTDSNSGLIILTIVSILLLIKISYGGVIDSLVTFLARYLFIILAVVFNFMMISFTKCTGIAREIWLVINKALTGRLLYGAYAYDNYGYSLFGQAIYNRKDYWQGMWIDAIPCDNAYMWMAVGYGAVYLFVIGYLFWKYSAYAKFEEKVLVIAFSLYTMMELYITFMYYSFSVVMLMQYVWKDRSLKGKFIGAGYGIKRQSLLD